MLYFSSIKFCTSNVVAPFQQGGRPVDSFYLPRLWQQNSTILINSSHCYLLPPVNHQCCCTWPSLDLKFSLNHNSNVFFLLIPVNNAYSYTFFFFPFCISHVHFFSLIILLWFLQTINDVVMGIAQAGISRYLNRRYGMFFRSLLITPTAYYYAFISSQSKSNVLYILYICIYLIRVEHSIISIPFFVYNYRYYFLLIIHVVKPLCLFTLVINIGVGFNFHVTRNFNFLVVISIFY